MDNLFHSATLDSPDGKEYGPFNSFYSDLRKNGFSITPSQIIHANAIIIQYANWVKNERELCLFLTPVFATNEEEQLLFNQLFYRHFKKDPVSNSSNSTRKTFFSKQLKQHWKEFIFLYSFLAFILVILIFSKIMNSTRIDDSKVTVFLWNKKTDTTGDYSKPINTYVGEALRIDPEYDYPDKKKEFTLSASFDWGDNSLINDNPSHIYHSAGTYYLVANIAVTFKNRLIKVIRLSRMINVCTPGNYLNIEFHGNKDSILQRQVIRLKAHTNARQAPDHIEWQADDSLFYYGGRWRGSFSSLGEHHITCIAVYGTTSSPCTIKQMITFFVIRPNVVPAEHHAEVDSVKNNPPGESLVKEKVDSSLYRLYIMLAIVFFLFFIFFMALREKEMIKLGSLKRTANEAYTKLSASSDNRDIRTIVPFRNKNYLPLRESELNQVAKLMRRRVHDNSSFLHIDKTIRNSINRGGMFQPVTENRTRQTEWLILIDENIHNNLQVKLFEYLTLVLRKQNVLIDTYYYNSKLKWCYNSYERRGISLEKLFISHGKHILLILGDAYQLIDRVHAELDSTFKALINYWQYKAIITPIAYPDWGTEEKQVLLPEIPIFPADMEAILLLTELLENPVHYGDILPRLKLVGNFYTAGKFNFENIHALTTYCDQAHWARTLEDRKPVNSFLQWIAALAVYPTIRWEMILAIGRAILSKYDRSDQLNYSNLLRLMRISWIRQGIFPQSVRLELFKILNAENEKIARETVLLLLEEIPATEMAENDPAFKEKETQQIINEFSLYANDPSFYSGYRRSKKVFEKMWIAGVVEEPLKEYLSNKDKSWKTLIKSQKGNTGEMHNVSVEEYFEATELEETLLTKFYLWIGLISLFVALSSLIALRILYIWDNML